jgi:cell division cycle 2-like
MQKRSRWDKDSDSDNELKVKIKPVKKPKNVDSSKNQLIADKESAIELKDSQLQPPVAEVSKVDDVDSSMLPTSSLSSSSTLGRKKNSSHCKPCRSVENYERVNFIDQGTYGMVFRGRCKETNKIYALKQVKINAQEVNHHGFPVTAFREINILLALNHPNIVKVHEVVVGSTIDKIYMVMEYCENDLKTAMKQNKQSFSTAEVFFI